MGELALLFPLLDKLSYHMSICLQSWYDMVNSVVAINLVYAPQHNLAY